MKIKLKLELGSGRFDQFLERRIEIAANKKEIIGKHIRAAVDELKELKRQYVSVTEKELVPFKPE